MLLREATGSVLRRVRTERGLTLREVAAAACCSWGYLSEVERGQKEASSEVLAAVAGALGVSVPALLRVAAVQLDAAATPAAVRLVAPTRVA